MSDWFRSFGFDEVDANLLIGAFPADADDVARLADAGVDLVYNLCEDCEYGDGVRDDLAAALTDAGIEEQRLPCVDYAGIEPEQLGRAASEVAAALDEGLRVYLHCRAGWQRSSTVAAAVIATRDDIDIEAALRRIQAARPDAHPLPDQLEGLHAWRTSRA